ncbi:MAG: arylsulfatase A [Rhodothermales bacterium]|jgi:arylsulfatase A
MIRLCLFALSLLALHAADKPNVIVFLTDDQGWGDLACYGHSEIKSPNLDRFADEGLRLTQCYAACSVCSPSRSAILTGRTPYRNGVWRWIPGGSQYHLPSSEISIASMLKEQGYDTCHAGKWHLNGKFNSDEQPQPDDHGYDHWMATQNNASPNHMNPTNYVRNREAVGRIKGPSAVIAANEAVSWLKDRKTSDNPFFVTVWTHEPHLPIESAPEYMKHYAHIKDEGTRQHHGNITQLDDAFGKLMTAVDELGFRDDTIVFFTSDNGPEGAGNAGRTRGSTGGLRGRKRATHEGGIRVPGIVRWPGKIKPGSTSATPVIGSDIFPTICEIVGAPLPSDRIYDGTSLLPLFANKAVTRTQPLYWRNHLASASSRIALRVGDYKIIGSDDRSKFELYNIADDWQEKTELSGTEPERFAALRAQLIAQDKAVLADGPDWWKDEAKKAQKKGGKKTVEPSKGRDETGDFDLVLGGTVSESELGYRLQGSGESLALQKLAKPITDSATIRLSYRNANAAITKNAALVIADSPTNAASLKIGTAIGMHKHVAFQGGWANLGSAGETGAKFAPDDVLELELNVDLKSRKASATIKGSKLTIDLPKDLKVIRYIGFYAKGTTSDFSAPVVSPQ